MTSRQQDALAYGGPIWGGWVIGPTIIGPEEFAQTGYEYVGFDVQHGYLSDADVALLLRRLEHVSIATVVRLPTADPHRSAACSTPGPTGSSSPWWNRRSRPRKPGARSGAARSTGQRIRHDRDRQGPGET
jgi:hypothetical protein